MCLLNKGANVLVMLLLNESNHPEISVSSQDRYMYENGLCFKKKICNCIDAVITLNKKMIT